MGCDIHCHVEIEVDGEWIHYSSPYIGRSYILFEKMAGVRGDMKNAIFPPKGLPENICKTTALDAKWWGPDGHSHSWLSEDEYIKLAEWVKKERPNSPLYMSENFGYLYGNNFASFIEYRDDYPEFVQGFRIVFWFDN